MTRRPAGSASGAMHTSRTTASTPSSTAPATPSPGRNGEFRITRPGGKFRAEGSAEGLDVFGDHAPVDPPAALLAGDQAGLGERLGVVADGRLRFPERLEEIAGAHLVGGGD